MTGPTPIPTAGSLVVTMEATCMPARFVFGLAVLCLAVAADADEVPFLVRDILPGSASSSPDELTSVNGTLFFRVSSATTGYSDLWRSDGTAAGTALV